MKFKSWLEELPYTLLQGSLETEVDEVVYDSRKAAPGTVFVCMRGANVDSHSFIPDVLAKGASVLVVEHPVEVPENVTVIQVENGRNALSLLSAARFDYPARKMTAIGVTGTKGKTTSTYMIKAILEAAGQKTGLIGTNGAVIGENHYPTKNTTPESYILQEYFAKMVEEGCRYVVMEVSSQSYLMHRVDGLFFDYGIFLNISNDHIGPNEHASFEEYLYYKKKLLKNCRIALVHRRFHWSRRRILPRMTSDMCVNMILWVSNSRRTDAMRVICTSVFQVNLTWITRWQLQGCAASSIFRGRRSAMHWSISRSMDVWKLFINQPNARLSSIMPIMRSAWKVFC